jgi:hypothetical protein
MIDFTVVTNRAFVFVNCNIGSVFTVCFEKFCILPKKFRQTTCILQAFKNVAEFSYLVETLTN